jgi:uncharacterized protein YcaQ
MNLLRIDNGAARRVFLDRHALLETPTGPATGADLKSLIDRLGFVQIDSVNTVARAHDMILWSRRKSYRPSALKRLLERERLLFEHWTHDASAIPMEYLPHWQFRFKRDEARLRERFRNWQGGDFEAKLNAVIEHVSDHGPVKGGDVGTDEVRGGAGWWNWHPSRTALEFLWRTGRLAVTRRDGFTKIFDLAEHVYPEVQPSDQARAIDWACNAAIDRLGFATSGEIAAFWGKITPQEAKAWTDEALAAGKIEPVEIESADGSVRRHFARPGLAEQASALPDAPGGIRILSPFDPALRDRARAERLFGFHYRIEIFVPEHKRQYGYYVFPVMEGDRLIGRIDARARREEEMLLVAAFWPEPGISMGRGRVARLEAELQRLARLAGCSNFSLAADWLR